ncbi:MAG: histidine kinase dimerization/phospho-acceptor domain-containing protein, partial [Acidimicrobiales bacterium]
MADDADRAWFPLLARGRRHLWALTASVRVRTTLLAVAVVAVALVAGGAGLYLFVQRSLHDGLVTSATAQADAAASLATQGELPAQIPVRAGVAVQVVDASGGVVSSSADLAGQGALSAVRPAPGTYETLNTRPVFRGDDNPDLTVATTARTSRGPLTVYATTSTEPTENSTHLLALSLAAGLPLLVALVGVLEWILVGRALRPVEAIRAEVADVTAGDLHRRVPEPPLDDEVGRLARTMNAMLARLEEGSDRQRQFVADASHELRSPLAGLLAEVEVARAHPGTADWAAVSDAVVEEGSRLSRIIDDLLLLARSDEGHLAPGRDPVDLDELVLADASRLRARGRVAVD